MASRVSFFTVLKKALDNLDGEDGDGSPSERQRTKVRYEEEED